MFGKKEIIALTIAIVETALIAGGLKIMQKQLNDQCNDYLNQRHSLENKFRNCNYVVKD